MVNVITTLEIVQEVAPDLWPDLFFCNSLSLSLQILTVSWGNLGLMLFSESGLNAWLNDKK